MNLEISCMNLCCDYAKIYPVLFATAAIAFVIVFSTTGLDPAPLCHSCTAYGCRHAPSLEGIEKSPKPMSRWDKPSSLDRKNYVLNHDVHGRWDNPESSDNCVKYVCQRWCMCVTRAITGRQWEKPETYEPLGQALKPRQKELCTESWCTRSLGQSRELRQLCQVCMSEMMYVCQKDMWMCISICMPMCRCLYKC